MSASHRSELLAILDQLSRTYPDWRLGQLIANLSDWADKDIWNVEDEQLLEAARDHLQQLAERSTEARA